MKRKFVVSEYEVKKVLMGEDFSVKMAEHSFAKERFLSFQKISITMVIKNIVE